MPPKPENADDTVPRTVTWVDARATTFPSVHNAPTDTFMDAVFSAADASAVVADAGCNGGGLAMRVAPRVARVVGADADEDALRAAAGLAKEKRLRNVSFYQSDLETEPWTAWTPEDGVDVVMMHLYASPKAFTEAARVLKPGGSLAVSALGPGQWRETRRPTDWAWTPDGLRRAVSAAGLEIMDLVNDLVFVTAPSFDVMHKIFFQAGKFPVVDRWRENGRWEGLEQSFRDGTQGLTESRLVAHAVKPA